jgi:ABC-2 type transport system permease protein
MAMRGHFGRSFVPGAWLGWQVESNWTDPFVFFLFSALKPIAGVMILVFMYRAVSPEGPGSPIYAYIYLGNAFYIYVGAIMAGVSYSILEDRERYRALKYVYIAPINIPTYLFGRAMARFLTGTLAVVITLAAGVLFFKVPVHPLQTDWLTFFGAMVLGVISLAGMGVILGSWTLTVRTQPWFFGDSAAAALYLFSGAIFPITLLPVFLQPIGFLLPVTYWLELVRRAFLGRTASAFPTLSRFSNSQLFGILGALTVVVIVTAFAAFRYFDHLARDKGMLDAQSNF